MLFDHGYNTHKDKVALPFSLFEGTTQKFQSQGCPESTNTIVEHLKKNRIDLGLYHCDVTKRLYVLEDCCCYWGNERFSLQIRYYTSMSAFLGYYPYYFETETLGGKITRYMYEYDLSNRGLSNLQGMDADTITKWKRYERMPLEQNLESVLSVIIKTVA
jgi:hypothetical protein